MKSNQPVKQKAVKLFVIWVVSFLGLNAVSIYRNLSQFVSGMQSINEIKPDSFLLTVLLVTGIYFIPMLFIVHRRAKLEQIKWLLITATALLVHLIVTLAIAIIILLCMP